MPPLPKRDDERMDRPYPMNDDESDDDDDAVMEEDTTTPQLPNNSNAFLDSFYGLTATDARTRAAASQTLVSHALVHPADAAYCLQRLLQGVCSGRTAARQGNAACLAALLQRWEGVAASAAAHDDTDDTPPLTDAAYVTQRLREVTEPKEGKQKTKGSEERDYQFGRLFGINAVVRSGILWREREEIGTLQAVVHDLIGLYRQKRWLREPVAHAICTLLQALYNEGTPQTLEFAKVVVEETIVPELLVKGDLAGLDSTAMEEEGDDGRSTSDSPLAHFSAEQIAMAWFLRATTTTNASSLTASCPLLQASSSLSSTVPQLVASLSATSSVVQPRTHLVWDALWMLITQPSQGSGSAKVHTRENRTDPNDDTILPTIWQSVVVDRLIGTTHEKRALALCLLRNVSGVEFVSSLTGRTRLELHNNKCCWTPVTIQKLLLDILCGSQRSVLQPLAVTILEQVVTTTTTNEARWTVAKALLECEPRFDTRTKTKTVERLLRLDESTDLHEQYFTFLEGNVLLLDQPTEDAHARTPGYMDLLFHATKSLARGDASAPTTTSSRFLRSLTLFYGMAFLDCGAVHKSKGKKHTTTSQVLVRLKETSVPKALRSIASARFFSLLADEVSSILYNATTEKETALLQFMTEVQTMQQACLDQGAKRKHDSEDEGPTAVLRWLQARAATAQSSKTLLSTGERKWTESCATLAITLNLHLLRCSNDSEHDENESNEGDNPDDDDDEEREEIANVLVGIKEVYTILVDKTEDSAASFLVEICVNLLASPLGAGRHSHRGASPTLLREVVKRFWINGLTFCAQQQLTFDKEALSMLLQGIGIESDETMGEAEDGDDDDNDEDMSEDDADNSDDSSEASEMKMEDLAEEDPSKEEIQIDDDKLQAMMLEDDDADIDEAVLEHHDGADSALAKFIQMKQDARKAGQVARERIALASHMRCIVFLETIVVGKPETWGSLLTTEMVLHAAIEITRLRLSMLKSLDKATGSAAGEKRSFVDRITNVLKSKVLKTKAPSWTSLAESRDSLNQITEHVVQLARKSGEKDHQALCASTMLFCIRHVDDATVAIEIAESALAPAVEEWATKRTTKIDSSLLDTLVHQGPVMSQAALLPALIKAVTAARSSYLKSESLRLVAALLNPKLNPGTTDMEKEAQAIVLQSVQPTIEAVTSSLVDAEMKKTKRLREVVKTGDKLVGFVLSLERMPKVSLESLLKEVKSLKSSTESSSIAKTLDKMTSDMATITERFAQQDDDSNKRKSPTPDDEPEKQTKKNKKKDKKKKKKGKR